MNDFNLFSIYTEKTSGSKTLHYAAVAAAFLLIIVPIAYSLFLKMEAKGMDRKVGEINAWLTSPEIMAGLNEHNTRAGRIENLKNYADAVERSTGSIEKIGTLSTEDLQSLADALPQPVYIHSLNYSDRNLSLNLRFPDRAVATETILRLKGVEVVEDAVLGAIRFLENDSLYEMTLFCRMKEGVLQ